MTRYVYDMKKQQWAAKTGGSVTLGSLQAIDQNRVLGRLGAGNGPVEQLPAADVKTLLDITGVTTAAVAAKAPLASPALTGAPTAPTAPAGTNTSQIATAAFVQNAITLLRDGVAGAHDTLAKIVNLVNTKLDTSAALMFRTVAVAGQSPVVADSASDTLTLVAGANVTITTNEANDSVTFSAAGGGIGGGTGGVDNALLRADGTGGATAQASPVVVADTGAIHGYRANIVIFSGTTATLNETTVPSGSVVHFTATTATTATVANNVAAGWCCTCYQDAAGQVTFSVSGGSLRHRQNHTRTAGLNAAVGLYCSSNPGTAPVIRLAGDTA